jgi:hypothetical protein
VSFAPYPKHEQYEWKNLIELDRRQASYGRKRSTRTIGQWLFFVPDWLRELTIVCFFDRPWPTRASQRELEHLMDKIPPTEIARCFVFRHHAKYHQPMSWLVLEKDPRSGSDPVIGNPIWHLSWGKRPPLGEAGRLLRTKVITADAAKRLGWGGETVAE